ncbi:MAG: dicarboxylate/amino acid:cation symporter [Melioribacteraceae bacterium]|nr:dicarboxylate/amino acid:cation symporter [Melioribacteraceae bacterium]
MKKLFRLYFSTSLLLRIFLAFIIGSILGGVLWYYSGQGNEGFVTDLISYISPFGLVFVNMLKMIVIPVIFFSLITGAASLPIKRFGRIGVKVIAWYFLCSFLAAIVGTLLAVIINPGSGSDLQGWEKIAETVSSQAQELGGKTTGGGFTNMIMQMFQNPFEALSSGNFLAIIIFSVMFGLAIRVLIETNKSEKHVKDLENLLSIFTSIRDAIFKLVDWILEYSPIGVFVLSIVNFGLYGPNIVGPYISVAVGIIIGILGMVFIVYPLLLVITTKKNPYKIIKSMQEAIITAFITRSSAATLPVSIKTIESELKVKNELASFSLPLGATINMDGVCVHLPMFAMLAANMFFIDLSISSLIILVITTVLASIGAGGVPGGSLMLLFIILESMGLSGSQVSIIIALALGINPILDMFETANNVTGDMVCTYAVADIEGLIED